MNRSIVYLKKIDCLFGPHLIKIPAIFKKKPPSKFPDKIDTKSIRHVLIVRPGGIGDAALLLPSIKILKKLNPSCLVHVLCEKRNRGIFHNSPFVTTIMDYRQIKDLFTVLKNTYDLIIDTEQSHFMTAVLVHFLKSKQKIGFATMDRDPVYDISVPYFHDEYEVISFFKLFRNALTTWPNEFAWDYPYTFPDENTKTKVQAVLNGVPRPVCIFPGASIQERIWPLQRWGALARALSDHGFTTMLLGGKREIDICRAIVSESGNTTLNLAGKLSLIDTAALFEKSSLLISTDSGVLHLGVICDLPTVSLFGPGIAAKWGPKGENHIVINKELECSPCTKFGETPPCPRNAECMKEIKVSEVLDAALRLLKGDHNEH